MLILGIEGSPRKNANSSLLLSAFMEEAKKLGAAIHVINAAREKVLPCQECRTCEQKGYCPIDDPMQAIYPLLREAEWVVLATPIFFYSAPAQVKALIDRSQALWAKRYVYKLADPLQKWRKGFLLSVGATKGKNLFEGMNLTARYFYDAVGARFEGSLGYRQVEDAGAIADHPTALTEVRETAKRLVAPLMERKRILFVCRENACRSQMAGAFAQMLGGDRFDVITAGSAPAETVNPLMVEAMAEKGIDMSFRRPRSLEEALRAETPERMISMGCGESCPVIPGVYPEEWVIEDPAGKSMEDMRRIRDQVEEEVRRLIQA